MFVVRTDEQPDGMEKLFTLHIDCSTSFFFVPAMLLAPLTFNILYHFSWPWPCMLGRQSVQTKPVDFTFYTLFIWSGWNLMQQFKLNVLRLLLNRIYWNKENNCCFTDCVQKLKCWPTFRLLLMDLNQNRYHSRCFCSLHFDTSLIDLDLDSRSQKRDKAKTFASIISQSF